MWSEPFIVNDKDGNEIVVLLMDTQGTFDSNSTMQECATIFSLSTMISSFQIYNISQGIQEDYLQHLRLFIEYGSLAMEDSDEYPFQTLLFLIRDWQNSDELAFGHDGGMSYLDRILKKSCKQKKELQEIRKEIRSYFERLICFLLPHPGLKVSDNCNQKTIGKLEDVFKKQLHLLISSIFDPEYLVVKKINGQEITCKQLMYYIKAYMNVFNSDKLPVPTSILQATGEANNAMAASDAKALYEMEMKAVMKSKVTDLSLLIDKHRAAENKAFKTFREIKKMGGEEISKKYEDSLSNDIQTRYAEIENVVKENIKNEQARLEQIKARKEMEEQQRREKLEMEEKMKEYEEEVVLKNKEMESEFNRKLSLLEEQHQRNKEELDRKNMEQEKIIQQKTEQLRLEGENRNGQLKEMEAWIKHSMEELERSKLELEKTREEQYKRLEEEKKEVLAKADERNKAMAEQISSKMKEMKKKWRKKRKEQKRQKVDERNRKNREKDMRRQRVNAPAPNNPGGLSLSLSIPTDVITTTIGAVLRGPLDVLTTIVTPPALP